MTDMVTAIFGAPPEGLVIGPTTTTDDVRDAYDSGTPIYDAEGYELSDLYCPACDMWIGGDDGYPDVHVRRVSVLHDVLTCGDDEWDWTA